MYGKESLEALIEREATDEDTSISRFVSDEESVFDEQFQKELSEIVEDILSSLSEREAIVVKMRNGIGYPAPMTLEEIGSLMNVTRERIRQIEAKAMRKMSHPSRKKKLSQNGTIVLSGGMIA